MSIRVALIGAGVMGTDHARIIAEDLPGATLKVVCDAAADRARKLADEFGARDVSSDATATATRKDVDAVLIATPDETHAPLTIAAIEAGKPTLCEKPLAPTSTECLDVIEAEVKTGRRLVQIGFMRRFDPSYAEMKAALDDGLLGNALMMHNFHRNRQAPPWFTGAMAITNSAPHEFDVARYVLEAEYGAITAFRGPCDGGAADIAPVFMVLETSAGQLVNIEINNNATYGYDVRGELVGEMGSIFLNAPVHAVYNTARQSAQNYAADWRSRFAEAYRLQAKAWLEHVRTGVPSPTAANAWDGYCTAVAAEAGVGSLESGARVAIDMVETPPLYAPHRPTA